MTFTTTNPLMGVDIFAMFWHSVNFNVRYVCQLKTHSATFSIQIWFKMLITKAIIFPPCVLKFQGKKYNSKKGNIFYITLFVEKNGTLKK